MSTPVTPPAPTQADHDAMFASVVWFRDQESAGAMQQYAGMYVAILGEQILDADQDPDELYDRVEGRLEVVDLPRVVLQYVHKPNDWNWK